MKNYIVKAFFTIKAKDKDEAAFIACSMQEKANLLYKTDDRFLLIDETRPIREGKVGIIIRD